MTIKECYDALGGNYAEMLHRVMRDSLVEKFALKFLSDGSFAELSEALGEKDVEKAFRAAHTLKGVAANLSFSALQSAASEVTEFLRGGDIEGAEKAFPALGEAYLATTSALEKFKSGV